MLNRQNTERDEKTRATYDETPYHSYTYPLTHPEQQALVARLLGYTSVDFKKARVLELGCASGGNILPLAIDFPEAQFYGIDLSPVQIDEANRHKSALNLSNIKFEARDIMDIDPKFGEFDYIICHGVFSWVPDFVRDKILKICQENLNAHGMACISFNVLPGWSSQRTLREMMILHTRNIEDPAKKIEQAKILVNFLNAYMPKGTALQQALQEVSQKFQKINTDSYVLHEYLEPNNKQFYFTNFSEMLDKYELQYVGDSDLSAMHTGNLGPEIDQALRKIVDNIMREQYIDYISNRHFRQAIITSKANKSKNTSFDIIDALYFTTDMQPQSEKPDERGVMKFQKGNTGMFINVSDEISQTLLKKMSQPRYNAYSCKEMVKLVVDELGNDKREQIEKVIRSNAILYSLRNFLQLHLRPSRHVNKISLKPQAFALSRYQAKFSNPPYIITANYSFSQLNQLELLLLRHLDGNNNHNQLAELLMDTLRAEKVTLQENNMPVIDPIQQKVMTKRILPGLLESLCNHGILIA